MCKYKCPKDVTLSFEKGYGFFCSGADWHDNIRYPETLHCSAKSPCPQVLEDGSIFDLEQLYSKQKEDIDGVNCIKYYHHTGYPLYKYCADKTGYYSSDI